MCDFLEYVKTLSPTNTFKSKQDDRLFAEIPEKMGRMQQVPDHSLEVEHLITPTDYLQMQSPTTSRPKLPAFTPIKQRQAGHYLLKKNISFKSPGVIRITKKQKVNYKPNLVLMRPLKTLSRAKPSHSRAISPDLSTNIRSYKNIYSGNFSNDKISGQGKFEYSNGDWYDGQWIDGNKHGYGTYFFAVYSMKFIGRWTDNQLDGRGDLIFKNGDSLNCAVYNKRIESPVQIHYKNSFMYQGDLKNGQLSGRGTMNYLNDVIYKGSWSKNCRHGLGVIHIKENTFFEGVFDLDSTDGPGVLVLRGLFSPVEASIVQSHSHSYKTINSNSEFGDVKEFPTFARLSLEENDFITLSIPYKLFKSNTDCKLILQDGKFKAGKLDGLGYVRYGVYGRYTGQFVGGKRQGWGKMVYSDPDNYCKWMNETEGVYEGEWKENLRHGKGVMIWTDGTKYIGNYRLDHRHNVIGKMILKNGEVYEGGWVNNRMSGSGTLTLSDGSVYTGDFLHGFPVDYGNIKYSNKTYEGRLKNLVPNTFGVFKFENGNMYKGNVNDGVIKGSGTMKYHNGDLYDGRWENGMRHGLGVIIFADGSKYEGNWAFDAFDGFGVMHGVNGEVEFSGNWKAGYKDGQGQMPIN